MHARIGVLLALLMSPLLFLFFSPGVSCGKIYTYVDEKGVIHFTNVPTDSATIHRQQSRQENSVKNRKSIKRVSIKKRSRKRVSPYYSQAYEKVLDKYIRAISSYFGVDYRLVKAVVRAESGFNPHAISPKGAIGLMQLMPDTAFEMGIYNPRHPLHNLIGGVKYLKQMLKEFNNNLILALAAYNAGPNAVRKYGGVPPYRETREYIRRVLKYYLHYIRNS